MRHEHDPEPRITLPTLANLCPLGLAGWRAAMEEAAGLAQGAHVRALTRPDHAEEILHHLVQRLLDRMSFAETMAARDTLARTTVAWVEAPGGRPGRGRPGRPRRRGGPRRCARAGRAQGDGWRLTISDVPETPDRTITADMVGQTIKGRAGSRRALIKEIAS